MEAEIERTTDSLILPFLRAQDDAEARRILDGLVSEQADPIIKGVLARQTRTDAGRRAAAGRPQEADAVRGETVVQLVTRLEALRDGEDPGGDPPIADLRGYVAGLALRNCQSWLRRLFPRRSRIGNRLRYLLSHDPRFLLRPAPEGGWLAGLVDRDVTSLRNGGPDDAVGSTPGSPIAAEAAAGQVVSADPPPQELAALANDLLARAGRPLDLEFLIDAVARRCGLEEGPDQPGPPGPDRPAIRKAATRSGREPTRDPCDLLRSIWEEILLLPPLQRSILLLSLRDGRGRGLIGLFPVTGVAGIRRIAISLGMRPERFAELWRDLPLDDAAIAARLRLSRSQAADLRQAALRRLARSMRRD